MRIKINIIILFFLLMCTMMPGVQQVRAQEQEKALTIEFYYYNSCASCNASEDFYNVVKQEIAPLKQEYPYIIYEYNTFHGDDMKRLEARLTELGNSSVDRKNNIVIADGKCLEGIDEIQSGIKELLIKSDDVMHIEVIQENTSLAEETETGADIVKAYAQLSEITEEDSADDSVILYFSTLSCDECHKAAECIDKLPESIMTDGKVQTNIKIHELSVIEDDNVLILQKLFDYYNVPEDEQQVPVVFYAGGYLSGAEQICSKLEGEIAAGKGLDFKPDMLDGVKEPMMQSYLSLLAAGLINGLNPCGASMFLMFLALLAASEMGIIRNGAAYMAGKYTAYLLMGFGVYKIFSAVDTGLLTGVNRIVRLIFTALFLILAVMYMLDCIYALKKQYGKLRMQLPEGLRKINHKIIRHMAGVPAGRMIFAALLLGFIISAGEFFCTGQVYLASIIYLMDVQKSCNVKTVWAFLIYVTAMCLPLTVILVIAGKTRNIIRESNRTLKYLPLIKLFTAAVFAGCALFMAAG